MPIIAALALAPGLALAGASAGAATGPAAASPWAGRSPGAPLIQEIAGVSPFAGRHCNTPNILGFAPGGKVSEPYIAVDPKNSSNRIVAWMDATTATVDTAYTTDRGRTWHEVIPQGIDGCTGNHSEPWEASAAPWISFGPDGTAYLSTLTWAHFVTPPLRRYVSLVHVQTSFNGGRTWSKPALVSGPGSVADTPTLTADPHRPGVAYDIWRNQAYGLPVGTRGRTALEFTRTADYGRTWSAPHAIATAGRKDFFGSPQVSALSSGTLVATSSLGNADGTTRELSWRSADRGRTWQRPRLIRVASAGNIPAICGQTMFGGSDSTAASGQQQVHGRSVLFVTNDGAAEAAGRAKLVLSRSDDGGLIWHSSVVYRSRRPVIDASVAVHGRRAALVFDQIDTAGADCAAGTVPAHSQFAETRIHRRGRIVFRRPAVTLGAAWWDLGSALRAGLGYLVGDYQTVAATPGGFAAATVQGTPMAPGGPHLSGLNGVIVAKIATGRARRPG